MTSNRTLFVLYTVVFISTFGYGISFPLLSISLENSGISGQLIGYNAAMPALGWLLGTAFLPQLQARFGIRQVMITFLLISTLATLGFYFFSQFWVWMILRFLFGGSLGLFYRAIEYAVNSISDKESRGRNLGIYSACFMLGIGIGATSQPEFGISEFLPYAVIIISLLVTIICLMLAQFKVLEIDFEKGSIFNSALVMSIPIALLGVLAYGMFEDIPAYLMSVYALRNGLDETIAAYTLSATAVGGLLFPVPLGMLSDKIGRKSVLFGCAFLAICLSAALPFTLHDSSLFLGTIVIWAGMATGIYLMSLTIIGDKYSGAKLALANASFGTIYAFGALVGPIINGFAIDTLNSHGMMVSAGIIFAMFIVLSLILGRKKVVST